MSKIDYQALREAAEQAMHDDWGFDADLFHELVTPSIVLALLDERERNQQYIKRRDQENEDIALTVGKLRVELEAAENNLIDSECHVAELEEALRDKQALLEASEKRIAELESGSQAQKLVEAIIVAIENEQERLFDEDYLMDSKECIDVIREEVKRWNDSRAAGIRIKGE
nr:ead/Ea22-like family protein [Escherichia coli]